MRLALGVLLLVSIFAQFNQAQTNVDPTSYGTKTRSTVPAAVSKSSENNYTIFNSTSEQEAALRAQIRQMHPDVLPLRIFFVPHWKYLAAARDFRLRVPNGYGSLMFTHLPTRTVFIDNDRYRGEGWLGYWLAHELGHLATNSTKEEDAEKAAREFRKRLQDTPQQPS